MEFRDVVRRRRMVRKYADRPVAPEILDRMLDHAIHAPSAGFSQGWAFLRLERPEQLERFWAATTPPSDSPKTTAWLEGMRTAPAVIVPLSHRDAYLDRYTEPDKGWTDRDEERWPVPYWHIDTGMAALLILQTAVDEGLGACFFGIPPERMSAFRDEFGVPTEYVPIGAITVGHRIPRNPGLAGSGSRRPRRPAEDVVHHGHW